MTLSAGTRLGPYELISPLGAGGMGEVYRARDTRLGRDVAVKVLPGEVANDAERRLRFEREARAIAALNHPHICALYDIGSSDGLLFLVLELLEGETLETRIARGPLAVDEAVPIGIAVVEALGALHQRGLIHRDLKPANVFLTPHGAKLLDFGLARQAVGNETRIDASLTQPGALIGTPRYMSPEQIRGGTVDARTDIFSAAAVIYEMLAGKPAFDGGSMVDVLHAVAFDEPAPIPANQLPESLEDALRQALAKNPADRPAGAQAFADALRAAMSGPHGDTPRRPRARTRLVVMPLRILRPDPETDFLAFSLSDAVAASLMNLDSVVVRSTAAGTRLASDTLDLKQLSAEASVDAALIGTIMRAGNQVRVSAQLVEVPQGTLIWSQTVQAPVQDLFQLQDVLTNGIVSSLELPLTARDHRLLHKHVPANPRAYEFYLRGNQLMMDTSRWLDVREFYERSVELDPNYAPAWARLGRVLRVLAKFGGATAAAERQGAERAFERAFALDPDLAIAHHLYTYLEVENGRALDAIPRLLKQIRARPSDPELYAGLVTTCRYCGLLDESLAAYERARRFDPAVKTSVAYTYYLMRDYQRAIETDLGDAWAANLARARRGEIEDAVAAFSRLESATPNETSRSVAGAYRLVIGGSRDAIVPMVSSLRTSGFRDPEGIFILASFVAHAGIEDLALELLDSTVQGGFYCYPALAGDPHWDSLRQNATFVRLLEQTLATHQKAAATFTEQRGPSVLRASRT